jgi:hypothetical protein
MKPISILNAIEVGNPSPETELEPIEVLQRIVRKPFLFRFWPKKARDSWYLEKRIELYGNTLLEEEYKNELTKK